MTTDTALPPQAATQDRTAPPAPSIGESGKWLSLVVLAMAQLMVVLDATIINIALPHAKAALNISTADQQWVVTAYTLTFGGLLLLYVTVKPFLQLFMDAFGRFLVTG